ncbi:speckle targeted PIP5K1A-regulated poly(A) polymerase-like isoform X2 [Acanthaster planci]|uniref:Speckle targeted PIP5K1A-regulated poly(A) polymerase n=1 Tax=Acanthaster planci TaxID=133434 RepID=A0A8B7XM95_ACAPL|nr:speckle targeted PIP5K1A-regulated poly(A) polymerase-like isoform X2 [Acanthaster planci]
MDTMEKSEFIKVRGRNFVCQLCDIKITSEKAVDDHLTGKKHQRLLSLRVSRQQQVQRSIFVGGLSRVNGEPELGDYFSKFGEVTQVIIDKEKAHYAIVEFTSPESAKKATEVEKQLMNGLKIVVRPRLPKNTQPQTMGSGPSRNRQTSKGTSQGIGQTRQPEPELDERLRRTLQQAKTVPEQMSVLVQLSALSQADQRLRGLICDLLQGVLEELLPGCRVAPFGSSTNGFGVQGCDLDVHLESPSSPRDDHTLLDITSATPLDILTLVSDVIKRCVPSCHNVHVIPSARLPVVKLTHKESGVQCDISINNRLALQNTKLLQFYSQLGPQVRPLVFTIRHWAKLRQLAGNVGAGPRLTNYALTLMVLFFLQAKDEPVIPSVAELHQTGDGWDSVFSIKEATSTAKPLQTQGDLLTGFFSFYSRFDFTTSVICPLSGKTASLSEVLKGGRDDSGRSFKAGAVNVQDPFELWHNVTLNVNEKTAQRLSAEFGIAARLCQSVLMQKGRGGSEGNPWGLLALFDLANYSSSKSQPLSNMASAGSGTSASSGATIEINLKASHLSERLIAEHPDPGDLKLVWCVAVRKLLYRVLTEALRFECCWSSSQEMASPSKLTQTSEATGQQHLGPCQTTDEKIPESRLPCPAATSEEDSNRNFDEPPPRKRCRVADCQDGSQSSTLSDDCLDGSKQEVSTSTQSAYPWSSAMEMLECTAYHHVWLGRRKARRQLQLKRRSTDGHCNPDGKQSMQPGSCQQFTHISLPDSSKVSPRKDGSRDVQVDSQSASDSLLLESQVTDVIITERQQGDCVSPSPILKFTLELRDNVTCGSTAVVMRFLPKSGDTDFKMFLHFFDSFFQKILDHCKI